MNCFEATPQFVVQLYYDSCSLFGIVQIYNPTLQPVSDVTDRDGTRSVFLTHDPTRPGRDVTRTKST